MTSSAQNWERRPRANRSRGGFSLIEVAWSCLLLTVLGLSSGSFSTFAQRMTELTATKRAGLEAANSRLEDVKGSRYDSIAPVVLSYDTNFLSRSGGTWTRSLSNPSETVRINGRSCPMVTTVQYVDIDGGATSYDVVRVKVTIQLGAMSSQSIALETLVSP